MPSGSGRSPFPLGIHWHRRIAPRTLRGHIVWAYYGGSRCSDPPMGSVPPLPGTAGRGSDDRSAS